MKTIMASFTNFSRSSDVMEGAATLAELYEGHVVGHFPIPAAFTLAISDPAAAIPFDDSVRKLYEGKCPEIKKEFEKFFSAKDLLSEWKDEHRSETVLTHATLARGRSCDIIVVGQEKAGTKSAFEGARFISDIILGAGRPVLVIPPLQGRELKFNKIAIGWNASREACRAAFDSLPILQKADEVHLIWVNPEKKPSDAGKLPGSELAAALARHDVNVITQGLSNRKKTASAIVDFVNGNAIDLLVLGAYGHMRLREQLLGGVTDYLLKNPPCPIVFAN